MDLKDGKLPDKNKILSGLDDTDFQTVILDSQRYGQM
jgi:hypothetical protein